MFSGCVGEVVVELLVDVSLDGGDLFLLGGLEAQSCSEWFELECGFGVELKSESVSGDCVVAINVGMIDYHARHVAAA